MFRFNSLKGLFKLGSQAVSVTQCDAEMTILGGGPVHCVEMKIPSF